MDFSDNWSDVVWSIEMSSFDCLEDIYIIFIQQMRYKNSHKQRLHKKKDTLISSNKHCNFSSAKWK